MRRRQAEDSRGTIRDIAREAGFSASTVSIVLNNAPLARYIPATTKRRIEVAARRLRYTPNVVARSLRSQRNHTIGVMVFDITASVLHADSPRHREQPLKSDPGFIWQCAGTHER